VLLVFAGAPLRTYSPVAHDDDLFLPTRHMGAKEVRCFCK
jgi:hypothetical protein